MPDENLNNLKKEKLIQMINDLREENNVLREMHEFMKKTNDRLEKLEREQNKHLQYQRRSTIEITGIPKTVKQADLEDEVIKIYNAASVMVKGCTLDYSQIQACH